MRVRLWSTVGVRSFSATSLAIFIRRANSMNISLRAGPPERDSPSHVTKTNRLEYQSWGHRGARACVHADIGRRPSLQALRRHRRGRRHFVQRCPQRDRRHGRPQRCGQDHDHQHGPRRARARVGLAKAMSNNPRLLLLDEPTASLDPAAAHDIRARIMECAAQGDTGILWTSHNMYEVQEVCHRVLFLSRGRILLEGNPKTLPQEHGKETLEELFIAVAREPLTLGMS